MPLASALGSKGGPQPKDGDQSELSGSFHSARSKSEEGEGHEGANPNSGASGSTHTGSALEARAREAGEQP